MTVCPFHSFTLSSHFLLAVLESFWNCDQKTDPTTTHSIHNSLSGERQSDCRSPWRSNIRRLVCTMVLRRSYPLLRRQHPELVPQVNGVDIQGARRRVRYHYTVELPCSNDNPQDCSCLCSRLLGCHQATQRDAVHCSGTYKARTTSGHP